MIRVITFLCFSLVICFLIELNYAENRVFYEFHIREEESNENDTSVTKENKKNQPKILITGSRTASHLILAKDANSSNSIYTESVRYTVDDKGYRAETNFSIDTLGLGPRLNGKTLKVAVG